MDSTGRAYEDFVPPHRMVREPPTHTLSVDLSAAGYKKEHIKVQMVHSHRRLIVSGERPVAGNRWSRFRLEFKLPDDCDAKGIQARFERGVVRVTMPGLTPQPVAADADAAVGQPEPAKKPTTAAAASGVQDGDRAAPALPAGGGEGLGKDQEKEQKPQEGVQLQKRVSSAKDGGRSNDDDAREGEEAAPGTPSRQGYAFLHDRRKMATTVFGVVLVLFSLGIYVRYSLWP
ncbi:hypothetical protein EJB05_53433 [Eragrostis curvula]|uniref:SHSP domain-containing protein n=1 Tax=Eragrostis curvula TaxID=38414 RepID=A0A5J9SQ93_9POAL|nr:hypothetical protein EJB05_53433 [Eragrostis curvula]